MSAELNSVVPKLRFFEFSKSWGQKPLGDAIASIDSGWSPQCEERAADDTEWGVLATTSTTWSGFRDTANKALPRTLSPRVDMEVRVGDILITRAGPSDRVGVVAHIDKTRSRLMLSDKLIRVVTNGQNDSRFVATVLGHSRFQRYLAGRKSGLAEAQVNITQDMLRMGPLVSPTLAEQQKIAAFLGAVDERIALLRQRRTALERYKKGVMQRLFAQTLRFKRDDGTAFPDWAERSLGSMFDWIGTNSLSREMLTDVPSPVQNIHYGDIHGRFAPRFKQSQQSAPFIKPELLVRPIQPEQFCLPGDVVIADASEDYADIGKSIEIIEAEPQSLVAGLHTHLARPKAGTLALGFASYLFQTWALRNQIMRIAQGISVLGISKTNLAKLTVDLPHPDEQRKIADFLSALDDKIAAVAVKVDAMQTYKKGLSQQMFV